MNCRIECTNGYVMYILINNKSKWVGANVTGDVSPKYLKLFVSS